jgi:D-alanyl-D-alanine carboxypeptidase/D-alanyl-D-alanine-endopeptidase (penicillin-binding protein 4)
MRRRIQLQRTIRAAVSVMAMAIACISAMGQTAVGSAKPLPLDQQIAALVADPAVARAHWGVMVTTLDGKPIYALNEGQLFQPASNAKLFTTVMAMALLGEDERFETQAVASGEIDKQGVLHGDLKLVGGGDASFGTQDLPYLPPAQRPKATPPAAQTIPDIEELADKVYATGLRRIEGNVLGDDWRMIWEPYPSGWDLDDLVYGYGAPVSALSVHDNEIEVTTSPVVMVNAGGHSSFPHAPVPTSPDLPYYSINNEVLHSWQDQPRDCDKYTAYQRDMGSKNLVVFGEQASQTPCTQAVAIADPAEYAAMAFKAALERRGVVVTGTAQAKHLIWRDTNPTTRVDDFVHMIMPYLLKGSYQRAFQRGGECMAQSASGGPNETQQTVLATHESHPLSEDVTYTLKVSQNLHAEVLLRDVGVAYSCMGSQGAGLTALREYLPHVGIDPGDFTLVDGSGMSGHDLVTPRAVAKLLSFAAHDPKTGAPQPWFAAWKASLPVGGVDGTLADRFTAAPLKGHVFAKTGTMGEANALSGYLECASGQTVIFSILVGNHLPGDSEDRDAMDKIVAAIAAAE